MPIETRNNRREEILDIALALMSDKGLAGTSMRKLANACDLNVAALYHYFPSKQALFEAVIAERQYGNRIAEAPPVDQSAPLEDRLRQLFTNVWQGAMTEEPVWRLLLGEGLRSEPIALPVGGELLDALPAAMAVWISESAPELPDPQAAAQIFVGQMFSGFIHHILQPDRSTSEIAEQHCDVLVSMLCRTD